MTESTRTIIAVKVIFGMLAFSHLCVLLQCLFYVLILLTQLYTLAQSISASRCICISIQLL